MTTFNGTQDHWAVPGYGAHGDFIVLAGMIIRVYAGMPGRPP